MGSLGSTKSAALYDFFSSSNQGLKNKSDSDNLDEIFKYSVIYLESSYTLRYGWIPEASSSENLEDSKLTVPTIFDTAIILDELSDAGISLSNDIIEQATKWILDHQINGIKVWNFFVRDYYLVPYDPDTTSNVIGCLYQIQAVSKQEAINLAENMVRKIWFHEDDGTADVYFKVDSSFVTPKWKVQKRVDACVISNVLYCLGRLGMMDVLEGERFHPCFNVLNEVISDMQLGKTSVYLKNYDDFDIALFFFSRVVQYSEKARNLFGGKIVELLRERFGKTRVALPMSCRILAAINVGMLENFQDLIVQEAKILIGLRDMEGGGWPKYAFYNAHRNVYFGSKAVTTSLALAALQKLRQKLPHVSLCQ